MMIIASLTRLTVLVTLFSLFSAQTPALMRIDDKAEMIRPSSPGFKSGDSPCGLSRSLAKRISKLGRSKIIRLMPVIKSNSAGLPVELVSSATGTLSFGIRDLTFAETPFLKFQRFYSSENDEDIGLGKGWTFDFSDRININGALAVLTNRAGEKISFIRKGRHFVPKITPSLKAEGLRFLDKGNLIQSSGGTEKQFLKLGGTFFLSSVKVSDTKTITIKRFSDGRISKVSDGGNVMFLKWSVGKSPRLLQLEDNAGRRVLFGQRAGLLNNVKDSTGKSESYEYRHGRLHSVKNKGRDLLLRVTYDKLGRVRKTSDEIHSIRYGYDWSGANKVMRMTTDEDYTMFYQHTDIGFISRVYDSRGTLLKFEYDSGNLLKAASDNKGKKISFAGDGKERLAGKTKPDLLKPEKLLNNLVESSRTIALNAPAESYKSTKTRVFKVYDDSDRLVKLYNDRGWIKATRDKGGRIMLLENSKGQKREFQYNSYGALTQYRSAKNVVFNFRYTPKGELQQLNNSEGLKIEYVLDETGNPVAARTFQSGKEIVPNFPNAGLGVCPFDDPFIDPFNEPLSNSSSLSTDTFCPEDPFKGFEDPIGGELGSDKCSKCRMDEDFACRRAYEGCLLSAWGKYTVAAVACAIIPVPFYVVICEAAALTKYVADLESCRRTLQGCYRKVTSVCNWACSK